jgi:site-specific DNA-methyltransferase (adenine-specific)
MLSRASAHPPLPRFTVLSPKDLKGLEAFFLRWGKLVLRVLVPGGHVFIASNPLLSPLVASGLMSAGFERRGEIIRLVRTLRGGVRPKLSEKEFDFISVMPRSCYEPWGLFRKPISEKRVSENLKKWGTGGLRRTPDGRPFPDVLKSETPSDGELEIAPHPSLKPQKLLRQLVWGSLPMQRGTILDPFMGSGSTIAACTALGYQSIGIETDRHFYDMARSSVPKLARMKINWEPFEGSNGNGKPVRKPAHEQSTLFLFEVQR